MRVSIISAVCRLRCALALAAIAVGAVDAAAQALVTPSRVGRPDAPTTLTVWAQQDYSPLAARPAIAGVFASVFDYWAGAHPRLQLPASAMPALTRHKSNVH